MTQTPETLSDPAVPGLTIALHSDSLFELLSSRLDECREGLRFLEGRAVDVQYTPGAGAQVLWKIKMSDPETGRTGRQLLFVRALRADEPMPPEPADLIARYRALRASRGMARRMPLRTPWVAVTGAHVVVHAFPLDPALPSLLTVTSPEAMKVALQHAWQVRGARVRRVHVDTLSYTPGARAALEYEILAENQTTQLPELRRLVGKIDVRREPARLFAGHWAVWRKTFGRVSIAPPVGYIAVARLSLQEFVTGTRLSDITAQGEMVGRARKAARAIASVHALNLPVLKHRSVEKEMTSVERWVGVLSQLRPAQAERLESLSNRVRREMADRMRVSATVHADFHLANILADRQGVTLIDWDQAAHGDAMLDVGRLLASLRVSSLRMHNTLDGLSAVEEGFLQAYLEHTGDNEQRARLFEAASLLTAAATPFRLQREGWQEDADRMIDEVDRVLSLSMKGSQVAGTSHEFKREVPFTDRAGWAMDRVYAQALLVPVIQAAYGADIELTETAPSIKKSTLSALHARWMIKGYRGRERWRRTVDAVGFSTSSGRNVLHRWRTAFYAAAERPSVLQIPRPLGRIGPLSMVVFERARGAPLHKLLGGPDEAVAMDQLGRALAEFHSLDMSLAKSRNSGRVWKSAGRHVRALDHAQHPSAGAAKELMSALKSPFDEMAERCGPTVFPLGLRSLRTTDAGVEASPVHDVIMADPVINAGSLLAQLTLHALERGATHQSADRFRSAYRSHSGVPASDIGVWEALMLLRLACGQALATVESSLPGILIDFARERFEAGGSGDSMEPRRNTRVQYEFVQGRDR